jgi:hypothetical protein
MKLNIINRENQTRPLNIQRYYVNKQSKSIYPQDKIDVPNIAKQVIHSVNDKQVELTYSLSLKKVFAEIINKDGSKIEVKNENLPKDLREINSPEVFSRFFKNTYAKVRIMSDGEYKFDINHKLLGGGKDDPEGSMTPRTQGKRTELKNDFSEEFQQKHVQSLKDSIAQVNKGYNPFINKALDKTEKTILALKEGISFIQDYQQNTRSKDLQHFEIKTTEIQKGSPIVKRFGIYPAALAHLIGTEAKKIKLHEIECNLIINANEHLKLQQSAENCIKIDNDTYSNNVVLVDIFVRDNEKIKEYQDSGTPETHTIALWKKTDAEYLLIDPSKVDFSKDLAQDIGKLLSISIKVHSPTGNILYGTGGKDTSYNELKSTPIGDHKHRDCVDIATKIGFEINELQVNDNITKLEEIERAMNLQISNQKKVATFLTNTSDGQPNRASQSSNPLIRYNNRQVLELMK